MGTFIFGFVTGVFVGVVGIIVIASAFWDN